MKSKIILRTHGGLGNQIFQVLYCRLRARVEASEIYHVHDTRYQHNFELCEALRSGSVPTAFLRLLSALRIPKVVKRCGSDECEELRIGSITLLDGYFQVPARYSAFSRALISEELAIMKLKLGLSDPQQGELVHIRLD